MSLRALRKLQGAREELDLPNNCSEEEEEEDDEENGQEKEETLILPTKGQNRFDLLIQGSPSESEVKEDDDLTETGEYVGQRDGASPQPPVVGGAKRKRKKKKKKIKTKSCSQ